MKQNSLRCKSPRGLFPCLLLCAALTGCVDDSYDLSKNVDMTMALGTNGLQFKLGSTEKIMLNDILEVDSHLKTDATRMYYYVQGGTTQTNFQIKNVSSSFNALHLLPEKTLLDYVTATNFFSPIGGSVTIPAISVLPTLSTKGKASLKYTVKNLSSDIVQVKKIYPVDGTKVSLSLRLTQATSMALVFKSLKNFKVVLPDFLELTNPQGGTISGNVFTLTNRDNIGKTSLYIGEATVRSVTLKGDKGKVNKQNQLLLSGDVSMNGDVILQATKMFKMTPEDKADVVLDLVLGDKGDNSVHVSSVMGRFAPTINPNVNNIQIAGNLPNFLQDKEVNIEVKNPTLKFTTNFTNIPASLNLTARLQSMTAGVAENTVDLPGSGKAELVKAQQNTLYFYQNAEAGPYDPAGVVKESKQYQVSNLVSLVKKLPDYISVNMKDGRLTLKDEDCTLKMGQTYSAAMDYDFIIPFSFDKGLRIVYNDSIDGMGKELQKYRADSAAISATIVNTIPLELQLVVTPVDKYGKVIKSIHINNAVVKAAEAAGQEKATEVELLIRLDNRNDLARLDKLRFRFVGDATKTGNLMSTEYLVVKDIRFKLKGQIEGNFN